MGNVMKYYNGTAWVPVASQYIDPDYAYLKAYDSPSNRNLVMNGAMQVHQRGTSTASISGTAGYYTADRWSTAADLGTWTQSVENDAPTGTGLSKSLKMLCTTANASPTASLYRWIAQGIEGQDVQRIKKGTASAEQLTLSFWVKSNVTGTYIVTLFDQDNGRSISLSYTISASATWEKKIITFAADTSGGTLNNDNGESLRPIWWLAAGSNFTSGSLQTSWGTYTQAAAAVGQVNVAASTNNYWQITGVQLETGNVATPFEFKSYGQELAACMRYYQDLAGDNQISVRQYVSNVYRASFPLPVRMRVNPIFTRTWGTTTGLAVDNSSARIESYTFDLQFTAGGNGVIDLGAASVFTLDAEL